MSIAYDDSTSNIAQPPDRWHPDFWRGLGELPDSARERTVADFLVDRADRDGLNPRTLVVPFCRHRGFTDRPDFKVGSVMREVVIRQRRAVLGPPRSNSWKWVSNCAQDAMPNRSFYCPFLLWRMNASNGEVYSFSIHCESHKWCRDCAEKRVESEIDWACRRFWRQPQVWASVVPYSDRTVANIRKRRERMGGGGCYWVRRSDTNTLHIYSSIDLSATRRRTSVEPTSGEWMAPLAAAHHLVQRSLGLPGFDGAKWNGDWERPRMSRTRSTASSFDLGKNPDDLMDAALADAEARLTARMGPTAWDCLSARDVQSVWLPMVKEARDRQWDLKMGRAPAA